MCVCVSSARQTYKVCEDENDKFQQLMNARLTCLEELGVT